MPSRRSKFFVSVVALVPAMHHLAAAQDISESGTGVMVRHSLNLVSALQLSGAAVCMQNQEATQLDVANYFQENKMEYSPAIFSNMEEVVAAYNGERCDAMAADVSELRSARLRLTNPDDHVILPERFGPE